MSLLSKVRGVEKKDEENSPIPLFLFLVLHLIMYYTLRFSSYCWFLSDQSSQGWEFQVCFPHDELWLSSIMSDCKIPSQCNVYSSFEKHTYCFSPVYVDVQFPVHLLSNVNGFIYDLKKSSWSRKKSSMLQANIPFHTHCPWLLVSKLASGLQEVVSATITALPLHWRISRKVYWSHSALTPTSPGTSQSLVNTLISPPVKSLIP